MLKVESPKPSNAADIFKPFGFSGHSILSKSGTFSIRSNSEHCILNTKSVPSISGISLHVQTSHNFIKSLGFSVASWPFAKFKSKKENVKILARIVFFYLIATLIQARSAFDRGGMIRFFIEALSLYRVCMCTLLKVTHIDNGLKVTGDCAVHILLVHKHSFSRNWGNEVH